MTEQFEQAILRARIAGETFSSLLLEWYGYGARNLPWRTNADPYRVWVSEIMLQQTRVETVIPYYENFLSSFPNLRALAEADEQDLLSHWAGLGYYSRARNLQRGAQHVLDHHEGEFPRDRDAALKIPGIGPYTSAAILSISFGKAHPVVDGNVIRVLSRLFLLAPPLSQNIGQLEQIGAELLDVLQAGNHNQAMMELGATVCTPKKPSCLVCPVSEHCFSFAEGRTAEFPHAKPRKKTTEVECALLWIRDRTDRYCFEMGWTLLPHLWTPPVLILSEQPSPSKPSRSKPPEAETALALWLENNGLALHHALTPRGMFRHTITTRKIRIQVFTAELATSREEKTKPVKGRTESEQAWFTDEERVRLGRSSIVDKGLRFRNS